MDSFLKKKERKSREVVRKYDPDYIKHGFIKAGNDIEQKAQ